MAFVCFQKAVYRNEEHKRGVVDMDVPADFRDLSLDHALLGSLTNGKRELQPEEWKAHELSSEKVAEYWERGFLTNVKVLTEEQCDQILQDYQHFLVSVDDVSGLQITSPVAIHFSAVMR